MSYEGTRIRGYVDCNAQVCRTGAPSAEALMEADAVCGGLKLVTDFTVRMREDLQRMGRSSYHLHQIITVPEEIRIPGYFRDRYFIPARPSQCHFDPIKCPSGTYYNAPPRILPHEKK